MNNTIFFVVGAPIWQCFFNKEEEGRTHEYVYLYRDTYEKITPFHSFKWLYWLNRCRSIDSSLQSTTFRVDCGSCKWLTHWKKWESRGPGNVNLRVGVSCTEFWCCGRIIRLKFNQQPFWELFTNNTVSHAHKHRTERQFDIHTYMHT